MKPASPTLLALLATRQFHSADLFTILLVGGTVLRYTDGDIDITAGGNRFSAGGQTGPYFERAGNKSRCAWKRGLEVDTLAFDVIPGSSTVQGVSFLAAVKQGVFDGAELQLERAFMPTYGDTAAGTVVLFAGRVADVVAGRSLASFTIHSHLELLNQNMPRNLYQAGCVNTLYDTACAVSRIPYQSTGTVSSGSTPGVLNNNLALATGFFDLGSVEFTSGANNGIARSVKTYTNGSPSVLALVSPFPVAPAAGDTFLAHAGCDKAQSTCLAKFANLQNFKGFPFIPAPETAI